MDQSSETMPAKSAPETPQPMPETPAVEATPGLPEKPSTAAAPETSGNRDSQGTSTAQTAVPPLTLPPVARPPAPSNPTDNSAVSAPVMADDVDVIEKEWVDKAKQIVDETKSDPYRQEQAVEQLQRSYLKKRYNKDLKSPNN